MTPNIEKIVAVWEKEPGLCFGGLAEVGPLGQRVTGCAAGSLLWATGEFEPQDLEEMDAEVSGPDEAETNARRLLYRTYGLGHDRVLDIIAWNDGFEGHAGLPDLEFAAERRDYMIAKVREEWGIA